MSNKHIWNFFPSVLPFCRTTRCKGKKLSDLFISLFEEAQKIKHNEVGNKNVDVKIPEEEHNYERKFKNLINEVIFL